MRDKEIESSEMYTPSVGTVVKALFLLSLLTACNPEKADKTKPDIQAGFNNTVVVTFDGDENLTFCMDGDPKKYTVYREHSKLTLRDSRGVTQKILQGIDWWFYISGEDSSIGVYFRDRVNPLLPDMMVSNSPKFDNGCLHQNDQRARIPTPVMGSKPIGPSRITNGFSHKRV